MATTAAVESYDAVIMKAISVLNQNHARITNSMVKNGSLEDEVANRFAQNTIDGIETHSKALCVFIGHDVALAPGALQKLLEPFGLSHHIKDKNSTQPSERTAGLKSDPEQVHATPGPSEVATRLEERPANVEADTEMVDVAGADECDTGLEELPAALEADAEHAHAASIEDNNDPKQTISAAGEDLDVNPPMRGLGAIAHRPRVVFDTGGEVEEARAASNYGDGNEQLGASVKDNHDTEQISLSPDGKLKKTVTVSDSRPIADSAGSASDAREESNDWSTARRSRGMKHQGTTFQDYGGVKGLVASPTIIKLKDGTFIELRCHVCNGNSSWVHGTYNKGVRGFQSHLRQVHGETTKVEEVLQRCKHREVSAQEAERIMNGEQLIPMVPCLQKINVGRNVEYVGNLAVDQGKRKSGGGRVQTPATTTTNGRVPPQTVESAPTSSKGRGRKRARTDDDDDDDATQPTADSATQPKKRVRTNNNGTTPATVDGATQPKRRVRDTTLPSIKKCAVVVRTTTENGSERCVELRCGVCGGNGSFGSGRLLDGIKGFKMHFKQIHKETLRTADIMRRCSHRDVPSSEVQAIEAGTARIGFIRAEGSPNVRPKASYQHFDDAARAVTSTTQPGASQAEE